MTAIDAVELLRSKRACTEAIDWTAARHKMTPARMWATCPRGDWMLWIAGRVDIDRRLLVRAACDCARLSLKYVKKGEKRPLVAIQTAEKWCQGKATIKSVRSASDAADRCLRRRRSRRRRRCRRCRRCRLRFLRCLRRRCRRCRRCRLRFLRCLRRRRRGCRRRCLRRRRSRSRRRRHRRRRRWCCCCCCCCRCLCGQGTEADSMVDHAKGVDPMKLSDQRVREILGYATSPGRNHSNLNEMPDCSELASLAQEILDLRTANGLLESVIARMEKAAGL